MNVYKFGGASVKDAQAVRNVVEILKNDSSPFVLLVFSAMDKTTNRLEALLNAVIKQQSSWESMFLEIKSFHLQIVEQLFDNVNHPIYEQLEAIFKGLEKNIQLYRSQEFDKAYDQIISYGELMSSCIVHHFLNFKGLENIFIDARDYIKTDNSFREAKVDWKMSAYLVEKFLKPELENSKFRLASTQGFIGGTTDGLTSTLGREGSDYTASIMAYCLDAASVQIWKDVPGLLTADPKIMADTQKIDRISYQEAIELAYYGAKIIHPKTIKPLQNKRIPLIVKSFNAPQEAGTTIGDAIEKSKNITSYIFKFNQILISFSSKDFSFIAEDRLETIFGVFARNGIKINMMQNSAISFSVCIDKDERKLEHLLKILKNDFTIKYNDNLELITIRHYDKNSIDEVLKNKVVLLEQTSRSTIQMVVKASS